MYRYVLLLGLPFLSVPLQAGQSTVVRYELNAYRGEATCVRPGTFFMVLNGIVFRYRLENVLEM